MYRGLFNTREGLSPEDFRAVGILNANLLLRWNHWVHRRVEGAAFVDEDVIRRSVSIDFTLPHWFHRSRGTPDDGRSRQLVPLGLLRKGTLVNFDLRDEADVSLPMLTTAQNRQVSEATLVAIAAEVLGSDVPSAIRCDLRHVVETNPESGREVLRQLFERGDSVEDARARLRDSALFTRVARPLATHFLALTMVMIAWHQRRVLYYAYDDSLWGNTRSGARALLAIGALGRPRTIMLTIPTVGDADSYHFEVEAPTGLQINTHEGYLDDPLRPHADEGPLVSKQGSYQRSHIHFPQADPGKQAAVVIQLRPRASAVRGAVAAAALATAIILVVALRLKAVKAGSDQGAAASAVLLALPGVISIFLARNDENPMTTVLLWPVRVAR
jgi:hypothetical protein